MGSGVVVIHPGRINVDKEKSFKQMVSNLTRIARFAEERNVVLGLKTKKELTLKSLHQCS